MLQTENTLGRIFDRSELQRRIDRLGESVLELDLDGALVLQRADLVYYTGAAFNGALAIPADGEPELFVWRGIGRVDDGCPLEPVPVRGFGGLPASLVDAGFGAWRRVGFEEDTVPLGWWRPLESGCWPGAESVDISPSIRNQRSVKSAVELELVRRCGAILSAGFEALRELIVEGVTEYEVQAQLELTMRRAGDQGVGRIRGFNAEARGVVASGRSAATDIAFDGPIGQPGRNPLVPMGAGGAKIKRGQPVICDHTAAFNGYMTDMTRTFYTGGIEARFREAHDFCVGIHEELIRRLVPGAIPTELYRWAVYEAEHAGFGDNFMNRGDNRVRFIGHGIGLEMDEWPVLAGPFKQPLEENMVIAVEPKIVFDDGAVGVEDTVIVRHGGAEAVTKMELGLVRTG